MALRRLASVAPAVATRCTFTAAAASGIRAPQYFSFDTLVAEIGEMGSKIDTMGAEIRELGSEISKTETRIADLYGGGWFRSNERIVYASIAAGFVALGMVIESREREREAQHLVLRPSPFPPSPTQPRAKSDDEIEAFI